jgi:protein gp37
MASASGINWTHSSFAPWRGCQAVSSACASCYSEAIHKRAGWDHTWGPHGTRERTSAAYWRQPIAWNAQAIITGQPRRVFASHLSDIFDNRAKSAWRADFWDLVRATPALTWLVLTKRISNAPAMLPHWWGRGPANVWLGVTAEDQREADRRVPQLLALPAAVHWISAEPLLEALELSPWLGPDRIAWVIAGGESAGNKARPMQPAWARSLRDQCADAGAAYWMKQTGSNRGPWPGVTGKGHDIAEWPWDLRVQQLPH